MNIEKHLKNALQALVAVYCNKYNKPLLVNNIWSLITQTNTEFLNRIEQIDAFIKQNTFLSEASELIFDIALVYHLSIEADDENYFDTPDWLEIEDKTIGRGTEMLNMLLYIDEANSNDIQMSLQDFLEEHLLIEDDEWNQDAEIYEPFIANPDITEYEVDEIIKLKDSLNDEHLLKDFFVPFALFFKHIGSNNIPDYSNKISTFEWAVLQCLVSFKNSS